MAEQQTVTMEPMDSHNTELVRLTHPADWKNPEPAERYNLVVVGAGTAGLVSAAAGAALGAKVALVERKFLGGDCLNVGCVPSKAIIRSGRAVADVRRAGDFGITVDGSVQTDFAAVMERMRTLRAEIAPNDSVERFSELGVDVFLGQGRFTGKRALEVDGKTLSFSKAVIATGARASAPPIPGLEEAGYLTNETVFSLTEQPKRLAVIGGGPIGCELAQSFARFGTEVHVLEINAQVLPKEPSHIAEIVARALEDDGVDLKTSCTTKQVRRDGSVISIDIEAADGPQTLEVDAVLVSAGRRPNTEGLGLEQAGVAYDPRIGVTVNDYLQTSNRRIYAAGDIAFPLKFTHTADALAAIVVQNALFARTKKSNGLIVPWCTYTEPEIAHVGAYPGDEGIEADTYTASFDENDRAILENDTDGLVEIYTKRGTDKIVGATIVASHAGEMISELTLAMQSGTGLSGLTSVIHPYPTQADLIRKAAREYMKSRLTPRVKKIMERWMKWHR